MLRLTSEFFAEFSAGRVFWPAFFVSPYCYLKGANPMNAKLTETLHAKSYEDAVKHATKLTEMKGVTEEIKVTCAEALATHPGNPANAKPEAEVEEEAEPSEEDVAAQLEAEEIKALAAQYGSKEAVLVAISKSELDVAKAVKVLATFEPPAARAGNVFCKVSAKGGVSLYGYQRMPITLYAEQWERLLGKNPSTDHGKLVIQFIRNNEFEADGKTPKWHEAKQYAKDASGKSVNTGKTIRCRITRKSQQAAA